MFLNGGMEMVWGVACNPFSMVRSDHNILARQYCVSSI